MTSTALRLAGLSAIASSMGIVTGGDSKVLFEGAILQLLGHPGLDVLMKLTAVNATLLAFPLSDDLPSSLERVGTNSSCVERHLCTMDSAIDDVEVGSSETKAARVNFVKVAEDFKLKLGRESRERVPIAARRNEG
jgi:hypothetical protein